MIREHSPLHDFLLIDNPSLFNIEKVFQTIIVDETGEKNYDEKFGSCISPEGNELGIYGSTKVFKFSKHITFTIDPRLCDLDLTFNTEREQRGAVYQRFLILLLR